MLIPCLLPLFDASLDENGRIEILELWNGLLEFVFPGTTFYGYAENGAVSSISTEEDWYAYDYTDCCFDSFGRYTYYSFSHWEESSDLYGTDWSRALTFRFDELGQLRTEAVYEVDGMENYASISYAYDFK